MGTISQKINYLNSTKTAIRNAIVNKGVAVSNSDTFRSYANKISYITSGIGETGTGNAIRMIDLALTLPNQSYKITESDYLTSNIEIMLDLLNLLVNGGIEE